MKGQRKTVNTRRRINGKPRVGAHRVVSDFQAPRLINRTMELRALEHTYEEIAVIVKKEFKLKAVPHKTTIRDWLIEAREAMNDKEFTLGDALAATLKKVALLDRKFLPIAIEDNLMVQRQKFIEGEIAYEVCEERFKEQKEAAKIVQKNVQLVASLLNIGRSDTSDQTDKAEGFHLTLIKQYATVIVQPGQQVEGDKPALALTSGDKDIDLLEGEFSVQPIPTK